MKFLSIFLRLLGIQTLAAVGHYVGRASVRDVAFSYRMGAGFKGDVNRTHPASVEPALNDSTDPATYYGQALLATASGNKVRAVKATDTAATAIYGISVRPYPAQQTTGGMTADFDSGGPAAGNVIDVLRSGYIMGYVNGAVVKGGQVFVWIAADSGAHKQGSFEAAATAGSTIALANATFNGPADVNGIAEIAFNV